MVYINFVRLCIHMELKNTVEILIRETSHKRKALLTAVPPPPGVVPYMGYIGMCGPKGYVFQPFWS